MITGERRTRLLKLARLANFIEDLPHDKFTLPYWAAKDRTERSCGTSGCVAGWAATRYADEGWSFNSGGVPFFESLYGEVGFAVFFGLGLEDAMAICFSSLGSRAAGLPTYEEAYGLRRSGLRCALDPTPRHAADRIRKVIARIDPSILTEAETPPPRSVSAGMGDVAGMGVGG